MTGMTYAGTGVNYEALDPFKRMCQERAKLTQHNALRLGVRPLEWSRGESVYLFESEHSHYGHVEEGLGTKNLVADAMRLIRPEGRTYYDAIAQDTVAMIVNDPATLGVMSATIAMHLAVGDSAWFNDHERASDLVEGWGDACDKAGAIWAGGETPTLKGIIVPGASLLAGSAVGVRIRTTVDPSRIESGDIIVFFESSGIHANGLTLARQIAEKLPQGYLTEIAPGVEYGAELLKPTHIYSGAVEDCINAGLDIHYMVNVTGHGYRKIMRAPGNFEYHIDELPAQLPIFNFIQKHGPVSDYEAYSNLNMGAGFALILNPTSARKVLQIVNNGDFPFRAHIAGHVEARDAKRVIIGPKDLIFEADTLQVR